MRVHSPIISAMMLSIIGVGTAADDGKNPKEPKNKTEYVFLKAFGSKGKDDGQFSTPIGVAIAPSGNIVVADTGNDRVQIFDASGKFLSTFGSRFAIGVDQDAGKGKFFFPRGIAVSATGDIVVGEALNHRVQVFDSEGKFLRSFGNKGRGNGNLNEPSGVAIASTGNVVIADDKNYRVQILSNAGKYVDQFGNEGPGDGQFFTGIWDVAITSSQEFVVSDTSRIQVFDKAGKFLRKFGEPPADSYTTGLAVTSSDQIVVAHMGKSTGIRIFNLEGKVLTEFGSKGTGNGEFEEPAGVAVDRKGYIVVADKGNHRIQIFKPVEKKGIPSDSKPGAFAKSEPTAEQIAERIADEELLRVIFEEKVQALHLKRIANLSEPIESRIARCAMIVIGALKPNEMDDWVKGSVGLGAKIYSVPATNPKERAVTLLKNAADEAQKTEENREAHDKLETRYLKGTMEKIAEINRLAGVVTKYLPETLPEARKQMKEHILKAIAKNPELAKAFVPGSKTPDELTELRNQAKTLIEKAIRK